MDSPWDPKESDMTKQLTLLTFTAFQATAQGGRTLTQPGSLPQ